MKSFYNPCLFVPAAALPQPGQAAMDAQSTCSSCTVCFRFPVFHIFTSSTAFSFIYCLYYLDLFHPFKLVESKRSTWGSLAAENISCADSVFRCHLARFIPQLQRLFPTVPGAHLFQPWSDLTGLVQMGTIREPLSGNRSAHIPFGLKCFILPGIFLPVGSLIGGSQPLIGDSRCILYCEEY